jgi:photosystem II stability/assembly factor-like uncharacterized protein
MVYRLDRLKGWTRIDEGLPQKFNIEAIDGFSGEDLYAVGNRGQIWQRAKGKWINHDVPTNADLNAVKCAGDGYVYAGGKAGVLVRGLKDTWAAVDHHEELDSVWDLEWFDGRLYLSTLDGVWVLGRKGLEPVDFGKDEPKSWYQLSAADDVLWSVGEYDIMAFDRKRWTRVV